MLSAIANDTHALLYAMAVKLAGEHMKRGSKNDFVVFVAPVLVVVAAVRRDVSTACAHAHEGRW